MHFVRVCPPHLLKLLATPLIVSLYFHRVFNFSFDFFSKFAAVGLAETLHTELAYIKKSGIKSTVVCPYYINTGMFEGVKSS